jgi:hypothetical protein
MNIKDRIKKEIEIQKKIEPDMPDGILLDFLNKIKYQSQWNAFVNIKWYGYGTLSYEAYRFYYPTPELLNLYRKNN